jgi:tetratricopeptide (TPR) repeat protein
MGIQKIKALFGQGRYGEALQAIEILAGEQQFMGMCYRALILCLRGEILEATPLIDHLWQLSLSREEKNSQFVVLALKTCLYSYQGKEEEIYQSFNEGQELLTSLEDHERSQIKEWEGWCQYGLGYFYLNNDLYEKPIIDHLHSSLEILEATLEKGGIEWVLRYIMLYYFLTNQVEIALEYKKQLKDITSDREHVFGQAFVSLLEGAILWIKGEYEKSFELFKKALPIFIEQDLHVLIVGVYNAYAMIFHNRSDFDQTILYAEKAIQLMKKKGFYWPYPWNGMIDTLVVKGDYQSALRYSKQILAICEENRNQTGVLHRLRNIATIYYHKGDFEDALNWVQQSLVKSEAFKDIRGQAWGLNLIGAASYQTGNPNQAIDYFQQALTFTKEFRDEFGGYGTTSRYIQANLAKALSLKGDFDQALELMQTAMTLAKEQESSWFENDTYLMIGEILFKKGEYQLARIQLQNSLAICEKYGNPLFSAFTLYYLILTNCEQDSIAEASEYLQRLERIGEDTASQRIYQLIQIAKGFILKKSPRAVMKAKAQEIFQQITEEESISFDSTVFAMLNLLELLIWELSSSGHEDVLKEIQQIITQLNEIAQKQNAFTLEIEVALIQSQLELIQGNVSRAMTLLNQAKTITQEKNLENHRTRVENQERVIEEELHKWIELTEQNAPLIDRIQQSQVQDYVATALRLAGKGPTQEERIITKID